MSLKERAYRVIKDKIIRCELEPGSPISEKDLMNEIGSSRTPLREAFNKLEEDHLITIFPKRGIFVTDISIKDIIDIYNLRELNEAFAAQLAAEHIDLKLLESFSDFWSNSNEAYSTRKHIAKDKEFHSLIAGTTDSKYLIQLISRLYDQANRIRYLALEMDSQRLAHIREEHLRIIGCLMKRDSSGAAEAMRRHLIKAKEAALKLFPSTSSLPLSTK